MSMRNKVLSSVLIAAATVTGLVFYYGAKPNDNSAYASNVMGSAFKDGQTSYGQVEERRALRKSISVNPDSLLDVYGRDVFEVFDKPEMVRRDAPTTVWQYRNETCVLDLYFTTAKDSAMAAPVVHYEVRLRDGGAGEQAAMGQKCVKSLARAHAGFGLVNFNAMYKAN